MQSRKSIPNVGRRAQGRKALFMLKGSGVSYPSCGDPADVARRGSLKHGSLTLEGVPGSGELGESPATYDESVLSQPSHPYNRIIQRILLRHQAAERKELHRILRPEEDYIADQATATSSAPPSTRNIPTHSPALSYSSKSPPGKPHAHDNDFQPSKAVEEEAAENTSRLQWADILQAKHRASHEDPLDLQSYTLSSPEDQSVSSLDLAKGYLTDRGLISDPRSQDIHSVVQEGSLDTTRSEPSAAFSASLPRLNRKRDLQPLDDVLDYFWVYQGMSRQLLDRHSPSYLWNREWFRKKPTKLPPLYIATGQKTQRTSPDRTSSVQFSRVSSEEVVTPEGTPRDKNETNAEHKSQHSRGSLSSELQSNETQTQTDDDDVDDGDVDDDGSSCQTLSPEDMGDKGRGRRVMLVVKMPVLTHETSSSDLLDND